MASGRQVRIWFEEWIVLLLGMCCLCSLWVFFSHLTKSWGVWKLCFAHTHDVIRAWRKFSKGTQVYHSQMLKLLHITFANKRTAWLSICFLWKLSWWWCPALSLFLLASYLNGCSVSLLGSWIIFVLYFKAGCISSALHVSQCVDTVELYVSSTLVNTGKDGRC